MDRHRGVQRPALLRPGPAPAQAPALALELAPEIRVNGVAPGVVAFAEGDMTTEEEQRYVERIPLGRSGTLDEAARTVNWMLLDAHYITGRVLNLCGGRSLH